MANTRPVETILICFREACNNAAHPACWNRITGGMYCYECARKIQSTLFPLAGFVGIVRETNITTGKWGTKVIVRTPKTELRKAEEDGHES